MPQAGIFPGADGVLDPGLHPVGGVEIAACPSQPLVAAGRFAACRLYHQPSLRPRTRSAARRGAAARGGRKCASSQARL